LKLFQSTCHQKGGFIEKKGDRDLLNCPNEQPLRSFQSTKSAVETSSNFRHFTSR
jgi:hypothetical protein